jgi:RHS repeat-associated protein
VYDVANERTKQTFQEGNYWDYGYDPLGQLTSAKGKESGGTSRLHEQLTYGYDAAGNLVGRTNNNLQQTFTLNNVLNQLSTVTRNTNLTMAGMTTPAATSVSVNGAGATLYADKTFAQELTSVSGGTNTFTAIASDGSRSDTNAVTVSLPGSVTFQHDSNGNLTSDGRRAFEYDDANQLTAVQVTNAWRSEFKYDVFGRRRVRTENVWQSSAWVTASETRYVYDHMLVIQERDANNVPTVTYTRGIDLSGGLQRVGGIAGLLALTHHSSRSTPHFFYHADAGGNITALIDGYQNVVARYRYDPFGNLVGLSGSMADANLYRFSSKEWHGNSGLYYYGYRFYDPSLQRWINRDPSAEANDLNLYTFEVNSPPNTVDAFGHDAIVIVKGLQIYIKIPILFVAGEDVSPEVIQKFIASIEKHWSGPFGKWTVTTRVVKPDTHDSDMIYNVIDVPRTSSKGANVSMCKFGTWPSTTSDNGVAHEAGHLMGLGDEYDKGGSYGHEVLPGCKGLLMACEPEAIVCERYIDTIIRNPVKQTENRRVNRVQ